MASIKGLETKITVSKVVKGKKYVLDGFDCKGCREQGKVTFISYKRSGKHKEELKRHLIDIHGVVLMVDVYSSYKQVWAEPVSDKLAKELFSFGKI